MNDVEELKQFVLVHAHAQNIPDEVSQRVLARIHTDAGHGEGSWTQEWSVEADRLHEAGKLLEACQYYTMARFPFVDSPARQGAFEYAVASFNRWVEQVPSIEPITVDVDGTPVQCWSTGISADEPKPLMLIMGGIVSTKEQWAPVLLAAQQLGMAGIVAELPGVGENPLVYDRNSWRMVSAMIDAAAGAQNDQTYVMGLSFSGHLALRCAVHDRRIRGIVTAGAPLNRFFTDGAWWPHVPKITIDTIAHQAGIKPDEVQGHVLDWAMTDEEASALRIPIDYIVAKRDEIIPAGEVDLLRRNVGQLRMIVNDDVHGSPRYVAETRLRVIAGILRMRAAPLPQRAAVAAKLTKARIERRFAR